jgi:transposase InsO family protein
VTTQLAFGYPRFREICKRHGIQISATRVRNVMKHYEAEQGRTRAWRKILEQTTGALLRQSADEGRQSNDGGR